MPTKEETVAGYKGSKEEFLGYRAEKAEELKRETEEVDDEVRDYEVDRIVTEILANVVGCLRTSTRTTIILTMSYRMMTTPPITRLPIPPEATKTSPLPRT